MHLPLFRFHPAVPVIALLLLLLLPCLPAFAFDRIALHAPFDDKPPFSNIGTGGAAVGEPITIGANLSAIVTQITPGENVLRLDRTGTSTAATRVTFGLIDDMEATSTAGNGFVRIRLTLIPSALDDYSVMVRESDGSTQNFLHLLLQSDGDIRANDAAGNIPVNPLTYAAGDTLAIEVVFDMDAGTHSLSVNGDALYSGRAHGITARGIGRVLVGFGSPNNGAPIDLDEVWVEVEDTLPESILEARFDDRPLGPIGTGGAQAGEPDTINSHLTAVVVPLGGGNRALRVDGTVGAGVSQPMKFTPLSHIEIEHGRVEISARIRFDELDHYSIYVRESDTSAFQFLSLNLNPAGEIFALTQNGSLGFIGNYAADVFQLLSMSFDLDAGMVQVRLDDAVLLDYTPFGVTDRGIGAVHFSIPHSTVTGSRFLLDDLFIDTDLAYQVPAALAFTQQPGNTAPGTPIAPTVRVGVLNVFDDVVPDGTQVTLGINTGPAATLAGNLAATVAGEAQFPALSVDTVGSFTLRAVAGRAEWAISDEFQSAVPPTPEIFASGFE